MLRNPLPLLAALLLVTPAAAVDSPPPPGSPEAQTEPGYLDILGGTAVSLDGELPEGIESASFRWSIVEGEGGQLFNDDRPSAVFLAPNVQTGMKRFVIQMAATYPDAPSSTRRLVIRVLSEDSVEATEGEEEDPTEWLKERYRRIAEEEAREKESAPQVILPQGSGSSMSVGVGVGRGGFYGGSVGFRFSLSHPIEQPVDAPPPGQTHLPGQGTWDQPYPVPYQNLKATFPASVAERYAPPPAPPADPPAATEDSADEAP